MIGAGEQRELGMWEVGDIAGHAAAEQSEHRYGVLGADDVGIPMMAKVGALIARMASAGQS